jgi:hypothetical protein
LPSKAVLLLRNGTSVLETGFREHMLEKFVGSAITMEKAGLIGMQSRCNVLVYSSPLYISVNGVKK